MPIATLKQVEDFWNNTPLFAGETEAVLGSLEWFREHEQVYLKDCLVSERDFSLLVPQNLKPESKILDVGCGPGFWVRYFIRRGFQNVSACDLSGRSVELTLRSLALFNLEDDLKGRIIVGSAESLPFDDEAFDHVNCQGVIHHTPNTEACVREFHRVLKPGGTVSFSVYYKNFILRNPQLFKLTRALAKIFKIGLKGRGREELIRASASPEDLVRHYDGLDNPVGKAYTKGEVLRLTKYAGEGIVLFNILKTDRCFFPARALPFPVFPFLHRFLAARFGLFNRRSSQKID